MRVFLSLVLVFLLAGLASADTLLLHDGRILVGPRVAKTPDGVTVHFEHGAVRVPADAIIARYDDGDPEERFQADAVRRHRLWRNRYKEEASPFRFETTMLRPVFHLHRDRLLAYHAALLAELDVESPDGPPIQVCLHKDARDFQQIAGASGETLAYFRFVTPREIASHDDPARRPSCLRALQWATASYGIDVAFPGLPHTHPLHGALVDYYGAAEPMDDDPATYRFGLPVGMFCEILRHDVAGGLAAGIARIEGGERAQRHAWSWAIVHLKMRDAHGRSSFVERLRNLGPDAPPDLNAILALETPEDHAHLAEVLKDHIAALQPTTAVDWIAAGRAAEHRSKTVRARDHYAQALALTPDDPEALRCAARVAEADVLREPAVKAWRAFLAVAPLDVEARESLACCLEKNGLTAEGERELKLAQEIRAALAKP